MSKERGLNQKLPGSQALRILEPRVLPCSSDVLVPDLAQDEGTTYQVMLAGSGTHGGFWLGCGWEGPVGNWLLLQPLYASDRPAWTGPQPWLSSGYLFPRNIK